MKGNVACCSQGSPVELHIGTWHRKSGFSSVVSSDDFLKKVTLSCYSMTGKVSSLKISRICCVILKSCQAWQMSHQAGLTLILFFSTLGVEA